MGIEQGVGPIRPGDLSVGDRIGQPAVAGLAGELEYPARHRHGHPVGGELRHERVNAFSRQIGPRQVRGRPAQHLVLLLQQPIPAPQLPKLRQVRDGLIGPGAIVNTGLTHPLPQRHRMDPEIGGDLLEHHTVLANTGDPDNIVTELSGIGPGHSDILPA
jgi:hypothetical protein